MPNSTLSRLLRGLSDTEWRLLGAYLRQDFWPSAPQLSRLWLELDKAWPQLPLKPSQLEDIAQQMFPGQRGGRRKVGALLKPFQEAALDFLALQEMRSQASAKNKWRLKALARKGLADLLSPLHQSHETQLHQAPQRDADFFQEAIYIQQEWFHYPPADTTKSDSEQVAKLINYIDAYHILSKLWYCCELHMRRSIQKEDHPIPSLEEVTQMIEQKSMQGLPLISYYRQILDYHTKGKSNLEMLLQLIRGFKKLRPLMSLRQQQNVFRHLINLAYQQMNKHIGDFYKQIIFDLYKYGNEWKLLLQGGYMTDLTFSNITVTACLLKKFDWAEKFIQDNEQYLALEIRNNATILSWAYVYFHRKDFGKVTERLYDVQFINPSYMLRGRNLLIRSLYEELKKKPRTYEVLIANIKSFKRLLYRYHQKEISPQKFKMYLGLVNVIKRLADHQLKGLKTKRHRQLTEKMLAQHQPIVATSWLQEKLEEWYD